MRRLVFALCACLLVVFAAAPVALAAVTRSLTSGGGADISAAVKLPYPEELPSGTVDAVTHPDDVYAFYLEAGAAMEFLTSATPPAQIALRVYGANATSLGAANPIDGDATYSYPGDFVFFATTSGYYYLDVHATSGASDYQLPYSWYLSPNDDLRPYDVPAPTVSAAKLSDWLSASWDPDDVYRVPLRAGDRLTANLSANYLQGSSDLDLNLFLLGPGQSTVWPHTLDNGNNVAWSANAAPAADSIVYTAPASGDYFLDVFAAAGAGPSSLTWSVTPIRPSIARTPSATKLSYKRGKKFTVGARVTDQFKRPLGGRYLWLQKSGNGRAWTSKYRLKTNSNGQAGVKITASKAGKAYYRWYSVKTPTSPAAYSSAQTVVVK